MESRFSYLDSEPLWIKTWEERRLGVPGNTPATNPFTMVIPPPNITGSLHLGHAIDNVLPDFLLRYALMQGRTALRVPGTDHAGIATQYVVEKNLRTQGIEVAKISRDEFLGHIKTWAEKSKGEILSQLVGLGCLLDFSRTRFTMDEVCSRAVRHAFKKLYDAGLIYRGLRMTNWCPRCKSALSDLEVEWESKKGKIWQIRYPIANNGESLIVATTRPETMLGDSAVAVHPEDDRYKNLIGKKIKLPLMNREIPIVADSRIDPAFGTGAVKITPGHDPLDWAIGQDHKLPTYMVIGGDGLMTKDAGAYAGLKVAQAREKVLADLTSQELLIKEEPYTHNVGVCSRCSAVVEPMVSEQWYLKMDPLREKAMQAYKKGQPKFYPESWGEIYYRWLDGLKDWCLSRQIIWGHRIPVWHCAKGCPFIVSETDPTNCPACKGTDIKQDPDVLDTWFSSGLWPMSVFHWPNENEDLSRFYPTSLLVTGYDITYLWVARMVMFGLYFKDQIPFHKVYLHGLIRDGQGRKMSKTLGNVIDPREMQKEYGTDALRFALLSAAHPGRDMSIGKDSFIGAKNFVTKIWNAARFIKMEAEKASWKSAPLEPSHSSDLWILQELNVLIKEVEEANAEMDASRAVKKIYDVFWRSFCDWYIEIAKFRLNHGDKEAMGVLIYSLGTLLKLLQPAMPFVSHEIAKELKDLFGEKEILGLQRLPQIHPVSEAELKKAQAWWKVFEGAVSEIRSLRADLHIPTQDSSTIKVHFTDKWENEFLLKDLKIVERLTNSKTEMGEMKGHQVKRPVTGTSGDITLLLSENFDRAGEAQKISKEVENVEQASARTEANLGRPDFANKAPAEIIAKEKEKLQTMRDRAAKLKDYLRQLQ